ncbi:DUF533 domain-containing protein [Poseidonocella sedimentorum]|uniref:Uncharacterized membrane protein YebE, DUF533 family n=1 Tax=Poseidonocella sedimentorum TaxID=871652 RepID=A0A1I6DFI9_9RHOB|nr:DUF533 domain-containing protein [Poseidonocella sedimentorum]SFR04215.1 Uncharacterized membrane protein YebE, DUF533 family [Poseidonocella sedimentorum]
MSLLGTLTKVAIGYAAAKGVSHLSKGDGLRGIMDQVTRTMGKTGVAGTGRGTPAFGGFGEAGARMQDMFTGMMGGGARSSDQGAPADTAGNGGLGALMGAFGSGQGGAGLAGLLAAAGGMVATGQARTQETLSAIGAEPVNAEMEAQSGLMLRAMFQSVKADGRIDKDEQAQIMAFLGDDATEADTTFLRTQLAAPIDIESLAGDTPAHLAPQVYAASLMTIRVDTEAEQQYLRDLAEALGLDAATVAALHTQMGAPAI